MIKRRLTLLLGAVAIITPLSVSSEVQQSGFLPDYSDLERADDKYIDLIYVAPDAENRLVNYDAIMIDQPEIFVASDSKYGGMKPDDMKALADGLRGAVAQEITGAYYVVDQPDKAVLYLRIATTNLYLKKKKKSILGYTPAGLVAGGVRSAVTKDITKKIDLKRLTVEMEVLDSQSGERLVAVVVTRGEGEAEPASWEELESIMTNYGKRTRCYLDNARIPEDRRVDCGAI